MAVAPPRAAAGPLFGTRLLPVGTEYDPFILDRAYRLDADAILEAVATACLKRR